jgi:hypothetical protein
VLSLQGSKTERAVSVRRCQGEGRRTCPATASGLVIEQMVVGGGRRYCAWLGDGDGRGGGGACSVGGGGERRWGGEVR